MDLDYFVHLGDPFFGIRKSKSWKQEAESGKQETSHMRVVTDVLDGLLWQLDHQRHVSGKGIAGDKSNVAYFGAYLPNIDAWRQNRDYYIVIPHRGLHGTASILTHHRRPKQVCFDDAYKKRTVG